MVKELKRTIEWTHKSNEGIMLDEHGNKIYNDIWLHPWYNEETREETEKSNSLFIDLSKGQLNTSKLVRKPVQVKGENGKIFTRMQWVDPETGQPVSKGSQQENAPAPKIMPHLPPVTNGPEKNFGFNPRLGDIDITRLKRGTKIEETGYLKDRLEKSDMKGYDASPVDVFNGILKGTTVDGLEHVFSDPNGTYRAELLGAFISVGNLNLGVDDDTPICNISFVMKDPKGNGMGTVSRKVARKKDGSIAIYNNIFEIEKEHMSTGISKKMYKRSEQYWKYLAQDKPVNIKLTANISIGVYSWAGQGFDFADKGTLDKAKSSLEEFCKKNDIDLNGALKYSGYNSVDDLKHSWDFSTLEDEYEYNLQETAPDQYKDDIKGYGHLGKAFMLGGIGAWTGTKTINDGGLSEQIGNISDKYDQRFNKEG